MFTVANLILMLEPYLLGKFLNILQQGGENIILESAIFLGLLFSLDFFHWLLHGPARCMERVTAFKISKNFTEQMFIVVTQLPLKWHKDNHSGKTINKITKASMAIRSFMDESFVYLQSLVPFVVSAGAIIIIMKWYGAFVLLFSVFVIFIISKFDKFLVAATHEINRKDHKVASTFFDYVSNIVTVITLRLEKLAKTELIKKITNIFPISKKQFIINEWKWFSVNALINLLRFFVVITYLYTSYKTDGVILVGSLMMLYEYVRRFTDVFYGIAWKYENLVMTSTHIMTVDSILNAHEKLYYKTNVDHIKNWNDVKIRNLCFKYEDEKHHVHTLKNISLDLKKGLKIAFVGESGSGKSTLMSIMRGLDEVDKVNLNVDGREFNDLKVLSRATTLIPQDPEIFENTIEYNISMGISAKKDEILKSVELAVFDKALKRLPKGLKTNIRERGVNLSGGEKQRLALARGIFASKNSSIILMDEPTSSVDSTNEFKIYKNLFKHFSDKCVISSIHKLHLLNLFDIVYVLDKGELVEQGSFAELIKKNGVLKKQWDNYEDSLGSNK